MSLDLEKENLVSLAGLFAMYSSGGYEECSELRYQVLNELRRRDHLNTLTYDERMSLIMEKSISGKQMVFDFESKSKSKFDNSWNAAHEAGRQVGLRESKKKEEVWNAKIDTYLRTIMPELLRHYGMSVDGICIVIKKLQNDLRQI